MSNDELGSISENIEKKSDKTQTTKTDVEGRYNFNIDINKEYIDIANQRITNVVPYTEELPNPKSDFIVKK